MSGEFKPLTRLASEKERARRKRARRRGGNRARGVRPASTFDRPPGPEAARFIEVENEQGESVSVGEWVELCDRGYWVPKLPLPA